MSRHLQHLLHARLDTAATVLDLPLTKQHLEHLAVELTPAIKALLAETDAQLAELAPVEFALTEAAGPADRHVTEYNGCRSAIHPEVEEDCPAALLALELRGAQPDVVDTDVSTRTHLTLTVRPQSLGSWIWWLNKTSVAFDSLLRHGTTLTGSGHYGDVTVHLRGENVGTLLDTPAADKSAARLQRFLAEHPAGHPAGHPW